MKYSREDILHEIDGMLDDLRIEHVPKDELVQRETVLKSEAALVCFEFLFNRSVEQRRMREHSVEELGLSTRTYNAVVRDRKIRTVEQLASMTSLELYRIRNLGRKGIEEILEKLARFREEHDFSTTCAEDS